MSITIESQIEVSGVPYWAFTSIGHQVRLTRSWDDGILNYVVGSIGVLDGTTLMADGSVRALVVFDDDVTKDLVDVPFDILTRRNEVAPGEVMDLPGRAGEILLAWKHGVDLKKTLTKNTFYRYRRQLLQHGFDIGRKHA